MIKKKIGAFIFLLLFILTLGIATLTSGCGGTTSGAVLTITVNPNPVTGTLIDGGKKKQWNFTLTFSNNSDKSITVSSFTFTIVYSGGTDSGQGNVLPFTVPARNTVDKPLTFTSASVNNQPKYTSGTLKLNFTGSIEGGVVITGFCPDITLQ